MHLLLFLAACPSPSTKDDTSANETGDSEADTSGDSEETEETDTGEKKVDCVGTVTATVNKYDGSPAAGVEVQFCETVCYSDNTDAAGTVTFTGMCDGSYKFDALGYTLAADLGWSRHHVELVGGKAYVAPDTLFLPQMTGPVAIEDGFATFGTVSLTTEMATLEVPFGWDENQFWAGTVVVPDVPQLWGVSAVGAVAFSPLGTTVTGPIQVGGTLGLADGSYDVYSIGAHGELEGPVGEAAVTGGFLQTGDLTPTILSWLFFVPA